MDSPPLSSADRRVRRHHATAVRRRHDLGHTARREGHDVGQRLRDELPRGGGRRVAAPRRQADARDAHAIVSPDDFKRHSRTTCSCRRGTTSMPSAPTSRSIGGLLDRAAAGDADLLTGPVDSRSSGGSWVPWRRVTTSSQEPRVRSSDERCPACGLAMLPALVCPLSRRSPRLPDVRSRGRPR